MSAAEALTRADRCDGCSAAAAVRVRSDAGAILDLCGHHFRAMSESLAEKGWRGVAYASDAHSATLSD